MMTRSASATHHALGEASYLRALAALVEHAPVGMCVLDRNGTFLMVNEALAQINGLPVEAHIGRAVAEIVPDVFSRARDAIQHALQTPTPIVDMLFEGETPKTPGEMRSWLESWFPLPVGSRGDALVAIIVREVTVERRMTEELQSADRRKDEFLDTLAHELRNPLAPLANCGHLLRALSNPHADKVASIIDRQLSMLTRLIDDISDASRIRSGKLELQWANTDLIEVLHDAIATSTADPGARQRNWEELFPPGPVIVRGDAIRLRQLFCNLLKNAIKFTPPDGRITVSAAHDARSITVSVADTGIGIAPDRLRSIFARLDQGDAPRDLRTQGLGIGLWLARELAERHDGSIQAFSDGEGCGSRFEITLPLRQSP